MTLVFSFTYAVDVFFMLGGFMVGFLFPKLYNRNPSKLKFITAIIQRVLRFWPLYIFALL
jgi:peptidoglycan/LPS O-acetylase OafA/YrhL